MTAATVDTQKRVDDHAQAAQEAGAAAPAPAPPAGATDQPAADELARAVTERDEYLEALQRLQAEYDNYRRRVQRELAAAGDRGGRQVAERLLEVLDAFDAAESHGVHAPAPLRQHLLDALTGAGLQRLDPHGAVFDPAEHHAVAHDAADDTDQPGPPTVIEVLRPGYRWKDRLVRPALVHVKG